jgi:prepilin signal peptidase PulO-like enzyme (type II secretory pathway)
MIGSMAVTGALIAWVLLIALGNGVSPALVPLLVTAAACGLTLATTDALTQRVPNWLLLTFTTVVLVGVALTAIAAPGAGSLRWAIIGLLVFSGVYGGLWLISDGALVGGADAKVAPALGMLVGFTAPPAVLLSIGAAFVLANLWGVIRRSRRVAFMPHLFAAALAAIAVAPVVQSFYAAPGLITAGL